MLLFPPFTVTGAFTFSAIDRDNRAGPLRTALSYELDFYLSDGDTAYISDIAYPIRKGTVLLTKPGDKRYTVGNFSCLYVHFNCHDADFIAKWLDPLPRSTSLYGNYRCEKLFEKLGELFLGKTRMADLRVTSILLEILAEFAESTADADAAPKRYRVYCRQIGDTLDYMKNHYPEALSSALLADRIHLSVNFFQTVFRELVGVPPARYLKQLRMESVCRMLADTDLPLSEIAELNGFSGASYLTSAFREEYGTTPSAYRRKTQAEF